MHTHLIFATHHVFFKASYILKAACNKIRGLNQMIHFCVHEPGFKRSIFCIWLITKLGPPLIYPLEFFFLDIPNMLLYLLPSRGFSFDSFFPYNFFWESQVLIGLRANITLINKTPTKFFLPLIINLFTSQTVKFWEEWWFNF